MKAFSHGFFDGLMERALALGSTVEISAIRQAVDCLRKFDPVEQRPIVEAERLPAMRAFPKGYRYHLLVDCESGDPKHWAEIGFDRSVHRLGSVRPLRIKPGDVILRSRHFKTPMDIPKPQSDGRSRDALALIRRCLRENSPWNNLSARDLNFAAQLLTMLDHVEVNTVSGVFEIPVVFGCGYSDLILAAGGHDPAHWLEVLEDGEGVKLGTAPPNMRFNILSSDLLVRPADTEL